MRYAPLLLVALLAAAPASAQTVTGTLGTETTFGRETAVNMRPAVAGSFRLGGTLNPATPYVQFGAARHGATRGPLSRLSISAGGSLQSSRGLYARLGVGTDLWFGASGTAWMDAGETSALKPRFEAVLGAVLSDNPRRGIVLEAHVRSGPDDGGRAGISIGYHISQR